MSEDDIIKNALSLFSRGGQMSEFRSFYTQLGMNEDESFAMLIRIMKRYKGTATMSDVIDEFIAEKNSHKNNDLLDMVGKITDDDSDSFGLPSSTQSPIRTPEHKPIRTFAQVLQSAANSMPAPASPAFYDIHQASEERPPIICISGRHYDSRRFGNNGLFAFIKQNPNRSVTWCPQHQHCDKGDNCSMAHLKLHTEPGHLCGVPVYVSLDGEIILSSCLAPTACFDKLRENPRLGIKQCTEFPQCHYGRKCIFAHYR